MDYIYKFLIQKVILSTQEADIDLFGDETIWATSSYGESGKGVTERVKNKLGVTKGGETVILRKFNHTRTHLYMHIHNMHWNPLGLTVMGNTEVNNIMEDLKTMIQV